jgi:putative aldouronate transport system substrate-binding protein
VEEMTVRFIMGLEPLENYPTFVEQLRALGAEEAIGAYQSAYDRYLSR